MTNEELAVALLTIFKPFGPTTSIKASRDQRGRPFGFVEYSTSSAASSALSYAPCLTLDGRRLRVEPAKRQRKLCIKVRLDGTTLEGALEELCSTIRATIPDEDFKLSLQTEGGYEEQVVAAVVKFEDPQTARTTAEEWRRARPDWELTWINMDRSACGSNVRNSGLVQLIPGSDGSVFLPGYTFAAATPTSSQPPRFTSPPPSPFFLESPPSPVPLLSPRYTPSYEEADYNDGATTINYLPSSSGCVSPTPEGLSDDLSRMSLKGGDLLEGWIGHTLFVGRLNGQAVTVALLREHFSPHGAICYIRLYNRGAVGYDGVPLDAYAFIRYRDVDASGRAIEVEHGRAWLGQAIKCEHARAAALAVLVGGSGIPSPVQVAYPGMALYYPMVERRNNWFRAKVVASPPPI